MNLIPALEANIAYSIGYDFRSKIKAAVNELIDEGEWVDGFELAVKNGELSLDECDELLAALDVLSPGIYTGRPDFLEMLRQHLPQLAYTTLGYMVYDDLTIIATDSLRVARFTTKECLWVSDRVSYDGIQLTNINANEVNGLGWILGHDMNLQPFTLRMSDGLLLKGKAVKYESATQQSAKPDTFGIL